MNGAEALVATAIRHGIEVCFANPGTTEMPLVLALNSVSGLRGILCLHENVATGAADGYGRMMGKPAMCSLHLGPGVANGLTNLHNARRAFTPVLNVIGQHATWHVPADPLLATDVSAIARTVSDYVKENRAASTVAVDLAGATLAWEPKWRSGPYRDGGGAAFFERRCSAVHTKIERARKVVAYRRGPNFS